MESYLPFLDCYVLEYVPPKEQEKNLSILQPSVFICRIAAPYGIAKTAADCPTL